MLQQQLDSYSLPRNNQRVCALEALHYWHAHGGVLPKPISDHPSGKTLLKVNRFEWIPTRSEANNKQTDRRLVGLLLAQCWLNP